MTTIVYIPHGGGPLPLLGHPGHHAMNRFLTETAAALPKPGAVVVVSAHWEEKTPAVTAGSRPPLIYDYYGFPQEAYEIAYPAPGSPDLAQKAVDLLRQSGIPARTDEKRGLDHGVFIPLLLMLPDADIPCIQISLQAGLDPAAHLLMGEALQPLLKENIWLLGSGFSFHNMRGFGNGEQVPDPDPKNQAFQDWLLSSCTGTAQLKAALADWETAPHARYCHPREEHLLPLMVCAGAAGYTQARCVFDGSIMDRRALALLWQTTV